MVEQQNQSNIGIVPQDSLVSYLGNELGSLAGKIAPATMEKLTRLQEDHTYPEFELPVIDYLFLKHQLGNESVNKMAEEIGVSSWTLRRIFDLLSLPRLSIKEAQVRNAELGIGIHGVDPELGLPYHITGSYRAALSQREKAQTVPEIVIAYQNPEDVSQLKKKLGSKMMKRVVLINVSDVRKSSSAISQAELNGLEGIVHENGARLQPEVAEGRAKYLQMNPDQRRLTVEYLTEHPYSSRAELSVWVATRQEFGKRFHNESFLNGALVKLVREGILGFVGGERKTHKYVPLEAGVRDYLERLRSPEDIAAMLHTKPKYVSATDAFRTGMR